MSIYIGNIDVYATKGGEFLGKAIFKGMIPFSDVISPDRSDVHLSTLLASDETTEHFVLCETDVSIYGFECYFKS